MRAPVAIALAHEHDAGDALALEMAMDRLGMSGRLDQAREDLAGLSVPSRRRPRRETWSCTPTLKRREWGTGLDWRLLEEGGVKFTPFEAPPSLRISLNGMQPEACELLEQMVAVVKAKKYVLRWESRRVGDGSVNGVGWRVGPIRGAVNPHSDWSPGEPVVRGRPGWRFDPAGVHQTTGRTPRGRFDRAAPYCGRGAAMTEAAALTLILWFGLLSSAGGGCGAMVADGIFEIALAGCWRRW